MTVIAAYPLTWPHNWPRTEKRQGSQFKTALTGSLKNVNTSLIMFGKDSGKSLTNVVISSNVTLGNSAPADPGVAVWFMWDNAQLCIAVDRYHKVHDNLQAIHHVLEARRTELRHGGLHLIRQTFQGFRAKALPAGNRNCWAVLGLVAGSGKSEIEKAYKRLAIDAHPNSPNGSEEKMLELNQAKEEALKTL